MDGFEATQKIRALGYTGVVIGVTANALSADVQEFLHHGVNGVVTKPVNVTLLLDEIEQHMELPAAVVTAAAEPSGESAGTAAPVPSRAHTSHLQTVSGTSGVPPSPVPDDIPAEVLLTPMLDDSAAPPVSHPAPQP
jgi:DNA-binding NarL/FixJ family response regulator